MSQAEYHKAYKRQYYKLNKSLSVTVSMDDYEALKARADELGTKPIPLLRDMAFAGLARRELCAGAHRGRAQRAAFSHPQHRQQCQSDGPSLEHRPLAG